MQKWGGNIIKKGQDILSLLQACGVSAPDHFLYTNITKFMGIIKIYREDGKK